ncbi:MAG: lipoprotein [Ferruginibacter sp.]
MKKILYTFFSIFILASCSTTKDYLLRSDEDKTLYDVVKKLNKHADDEQANKALAEVYKQVHQRHLKNIASYSSYREINRWDKIINEYNILQSMFSAIQGSDAASRLVSPVNYQNEIAGIKKDAAEAYYQLGQNYLDNPGRENARNAYMSFKKSAGWVRDYKDSKAMMEEAFNNGTVNVVINPVQDNSFFFNTGWGNTGYNYSNEYFQQNLARDLGGIYSTRYPARFYTEWEARRDNVQPDWVVDLTLRNMDIPRPAIYNYSRNLSKQIQVSSDTSGKPVYKTVYATLHIQRQSFIARAQMDVNITELSTRRSIGYNSYADTYHWEDEVATYSGDKRALDNNDWALINNNNLSSPRKEDILNSLYRNIYPQVKNRISNEVDW